MAILKGLREHLIGEGKLTMLGNVHQEVHDDDLTANSMNIMCDWNEYYDDVSGKSLIPEMVREARAEEMKIFESFPVYKKVPVQEAHRTLEKVPSA